jgi:hypothetical protein
MFALTDILSFEGDKIKILKPVWAVIAEYLVKFLVLVSLVFAGMQFTSGTFECLPAVECPAISRRNTNSSSLISQIKYRNVCESFYSSQKTRNTETTYVITDIKTIIQYAGFVNSECSKCAIPKFLAYFWIVLFAESFALLVIGNLWLKIPAIASFLERFSTLVMECYNSPSSNFQQAQILQRSTTTRRVSDISLVEHQMENDLDIINKTKELNFKDDTPTVNAVKTLHEKVNQLKKSIKSSHRFLKIWQVYLIQCLLQTLFSFVFFVIDINYMNDLPDKMTCNITEHIPVPHEYFICSHSLAPTFAGGLKYIYIPVLVLSFLIFSSMIVWTVIIVMKKCKYEVHTEDINIPAICTEEDDDDLEFLLHLLHHSNKIYVVRFAAFFGEIQVYVLANEWPVSKLREKLEEGNRTVEFNDLPGIPLTIFHMANEMERLHLINCGPLDNDDFKYFTKLTLLRQLDIIECGLTCIPDNILKLQRLKYLYLRGNSIKLIPTDTSEFMLKNLIVLDLRNNKLKSIETFEHFDNLTDVRLEGNPELEMLALKAVLECEKLLKLKIPEHLRHRVNELNTLEQDKFNKVIQPAGYDYSEDPDHDDEDPEHQHWRIDKASHTDTITEV